ncbi:hypothetical protein [Allocoleopsis franciscana]|uniref:Uncharacterized protein n=1 Tax=Allocoleopsis franciscana PCC 7113 TaxID=1173027 RepID=K9WF87_9CYAN|nr:hypothetical protein [Allocoleopsis franciscana]AFZ18439.1 hypothetical protein Mic7113_2651 [Allocoleopsis franciscana PCC 7113]
MSFFDNSVPPLCCKPTNLDISPQQKVLYLSWGRGKHRFYLRIYTRVDLACLLWALVLIPIFVTPQFFALSWTVQAGLWSSLSLIGLAAMVAMSHEWVKVERVSWVLYCWVILILIGLLVTDLGIILIWSGVIANLCSLWLGLSALGYWCTGLALHSRAIIAAGFFQLLSIGVLPYVRSWQFLFTGSVMVLALILLAEFRWDILPSQLRNKASNSSYSQLQIRTKHN